MFKVTFGAPTRIASQGELQSHFQSDRIYLEDGASITFEGEIELGPEVVLAGACFFSGPTQINNGSVLTNVRFGSRNVVRAYSILSDVVVGDRNLFGPFCFIRDNCRVADDCILGAHVETTRSTFDDGVKISHRAFVGDAKVGEQTIIGAGVVFCNFDGKDRHPTVVGARVTVGSGSLLVPPLTIGEDVTIAAGSTVTKDVASRTKLIQKR